MNVDTNLSNKASTLTVAGKEVVKAEVQDYKLTLTWIDRDWEEWHELQQSSDLADVKKDAQEKLDRVKAYSTSKGKGKGPEE